MTDRILQIGEKGLEAADAKVQAMMNNIVNAQTPGFKKSEVSLKSFPFALENATKAIDSKAMLPKVTGVYQSQQKGALHMTGKPTDVAIGGDGFLVLQGNEGELYTRDGRFELDKDGILVSTAGKYPVMGQSGPVAVIPGSKLEINQNGEVLVDDVMTDRLRVVVFDDTSKLSSVNSTLFKLPENGSLGYREETNPRVAQGYVEASNVSVMDETMNMVLLSRIYATESKVVAAREASLTRAIEMGRPSQ